MQFNVALVLFCKLFSSLIARTIITTEAVNINSNKRLELSKVVRILEQNSNHLSLEYAAGNIGMWGLIFWPISPHSHLNFFEGKIFTCKTNLKHVLKLPIIFSL